MHVWLSRGLAILALLALALIPASAQLPRVIDQARRITVQAQSIEAFDPREPKRTRFGALTFRGGLILESTDKDFGGLSGLKVMADGEQLVAVSDKGQWLRGRIRYRGNVPTALADTEMAPILGPDGRTLKARGWYDTEALAIDDGVAWVGIERVHQIVRFDFARGGGLKARGAPVAVPPTMKRLPSNQGIECLAAVPRTVSNALLAGRLIAISERGLDSRGNINGFLLGEAGGTFSLKRTDEFDVSDCTLTPDNKLLVLERRFSWVRGLAMRIRIIALDDIKPGATVDGRELMFADLAYQIDNMEGISAHRDASGATVLTLISDDNFSALQRTLLLQFSLDAK